MGISMETRFYWVKNPVKVFVRNHMYDTYSYKTSVCFLTLYILLQLYFTLFRLCPYTGKQNYRIYQHLE